MMRKASVLVLLGLTLAACGDETLDKGEDGDADTDTSDTDDDTDGGGGGDEDDDGGGGGGGDYFEPVAIGFEYVGGWDPEAGELTGWTFDDDTTQDEPYIRVTVTDIEFFSASGDDQLGHYCEMYFGFDHATDDNLQAFTAGDPEGANPWGVKGDEADLWGGWSGNLVYWSSSDDTQDVCLNFDPEQWPGYTDEETGEEILPAGSPFYMFHGMSFGLGFGPVTDYLLGLWTEEELETYGDALFTTYVGMNLPNADGEAELVAYDWSYGLLWEWDGVGGKLMTETRDDGEYLVPENHADGAQDGFVGSYAYWYHDFPLIDFSLLWD